MIGDDANLIRRFPPMVGRIFAVAISRDGKSIAAGSSLDGTGQVRIYAYGPTGEMPDDIAAIVAKRTAVRSEEEKLRLEKFHNQGVQLVSENALAQSGIYALAFHPDGKTVAAAGSDGKVRLIDAGTGQLVNEFLPVQLQSQSPPPAAQPPSLTQTEAPTERESLDPRDKLASIEVWPAEAKIERRYDVAQFVVTGRLESGDSVNVTRMVDVSASADVVQISPSGLARAKANGRAELTFELADKTATATMEVAGVEADFTVDFIRDVMPVLAKAGCNSGRCTA